MAKKQIEAKLYEIAGDMQALWELLNDPEIDEDTIVDTAEAVEGELQVKIGSCGAVYKNLEYEIAGLDGKIKYLDDIVKSLKAHKKALENNKNRFSSYIMRCMMAAGYNSISSDQFEFKIQGNGGVQPLKIVDGADVPMEYLKAEVVYSNDTDKIREYLATCQDNKCEWAYLEPRGKRLVIK